MRNRYANCVARGVGSTFSCGKRHQSAMTASSGFKGSYDCCIEPGHEKAQCFKFLRKSGRGSLSSSGVERMI